MLRLAVAASALIWGAYAQLPYTQTQAQSFQSLSRDVLAAVAPSIDPMYKLAAQTSLTFKGGEAEKKDHWNQIQYAMGDTITFSVVNAERVLSFRALVAASPDSLANLISDWATVPLENIVVTKDDGDTGATQMQTARLLTYYNVTVLPRIDVLNARSPYVSQLDTVVGLIKDMPPICFEEAACLCKITKRTTTWQDGCLGTFTNATVGIRFTIDVFADYDQPNSAMANTITSAWLTR